MVCACARACACAQPAAGRTDRVRSTAAHGAKAGRDLAPCQPCAFYLGGGVRGNRGGNAVERALVSQNSAGAMSGATASMQLAVSRDDV